MCPRAAPRRTCSQLMVLSLIAALMSLSCARRVRPAPARARRREPRPPLHSRPCPRARTRTRTRIRGPSPAGSRAPASPGRQCPCPTWLPRQGRRGGGLERGMREKGEGERRAREGVPLRPSPCDLPACSVRSPCSTLSPLRVSSSSLFERAFSKCCQRRRRRLCRCPWPPPPPPPPPPLRLLPRLVLQRRPCRRTRSRPRSASTSRRRSPWSWSSTLAWFAALAGTRAGGAHGGGGGWGYTASWCCRTLTARSPSCGCKVLLRREGVHEGPG